MIICRVCFLIFSILVIHTLDVFACSRVKILPTNFDSSKYVFIGKVIGYTKPTESKSLNDMFFGLDINVVDKTYLPNDANKHYEVFLYALQSNCQLSPVSEEYLREYYPMGCELRIVASETKYLSLASDSNIVRFDIDPFKDCVISLNVADIPEVYSNSKFEYDYRNMQSKMADEFVNKVERLYSKEYASALTYSYLYRSDYEIQKDLLRLSSSDDDIRNIEILKRLAYYYYSVSLYSKVVDQYIKDTNIKHELINNYPLQK